jgi:hypothetical protein
MGGSSAPSGETRYNWNEDMGPRWNSLLNTAPWAANFEMNQAGNVTGIKPRAQYGVDVRNPDGSVTPGAKRFADLAYDQTAAGSNIRSLNEDSTGTIEAGNAARGEVSKTLGGEYLGEQGNPYMGLTTAGLNSYIGGNQHANQNTTTDRNAFAGNNPYFRDTMNQGLEDITSAYQNGTAADTTRMFNLAGAFGGSAHQKKMANNEAALGKSLGNFADSMLNQQYNRSAGLEDAYLGRDVQNQQFNKGQNASLMENQINRGFQNFNMGLDRGMQGWEGERNRMMGAVGAGQNEQGMALQRAGAQMGVGEMFQGHDQRNKDFLFDQWNQNQQHPFTMMDWLSGLYGRAQGGMAPNSQVYQSGASGAMPYAGAALGLASLFG